MKKKYIFYVICKEGYLTRSENFIKELNGDVLFFKSKGQAEKNCYKKENETIKKVTFNLESVE